MSFVPNFNQTQITFVVIIFALLMCLYNFNLCGSVYCYNKFKENFGINKNVKNYNLNKKQKKRNNTYTRVPQFIRNDGPSSNYHVDAYNTLLGRGKYDFLSTFKQFDF